jgi:DNA polymerase IV
LSVEQPPSPPGRSILLVDCDAFFVQVARLEDPEGAGRADLLLVGGRSGRGVVTSASYPARAFGVRSGMPMAEAMRRCPDALVVPVPRGACVKRSRAVRVELEALAPVVQAASIDEFYLDLTGTERLFGGAPLPETASRMRARVGDSTGISVSIGGGTNRLVAKLAAGRAKPGGRSAGSGVFVVPPGEEAAFLATFRLREIPGVGPTLAATLEERGIRTVPELLAVEPEWLARWIGEGRARWLRDRALGRGASDVTPGEARKSISSERTFGVDVPPGGAGDAELERRLLQLVLSVGSTLREKGLRARTITVKLRDADFTTRQRSRTLAEPIESDRAIHELARGMLAELRGRGRSTRLLGVGVSGFDDEAGQLDLLADDPHAGPPTVESERDRTLSRVADRVRARYGDDALRPGRVIDG